MRIRLSGVNSSRYKDSLFYIFLIIFSIYSLSFGIVTAITNNQTSNDTSIDSEIVEQEQQYSSFFITLLDNPVSSTILSALAIGVITYVVTKVRSIKSDLGEIPVVKKGQLDINSKLDTMLRKMEERDTKYDQKIGDISSKIDTVQTSINTKVETIKTDLDGKIWELVMGKNRKQS